CPAEERVRSRAVASSLERKWGDERSRPDDARRVDAHEVLARSLSPPRHAVRSGGEVRQAERPYRDSVAALDLDDDVGLAGEDEPSRRVATGVADGERAQRLVEREHPLRC